VVSHPNGSACARPSDLRNGQWKRHEDLIVGDLEFRKRLR